MGSDTRKYPQHTVAVPDPRWDRFGTVCQQLGTDRSKLLNLVMAWYGREEGVVLPRRPVMPSSERPDDTTT